MSTANANANANAGRWSGLTRLVTDAVVHGSSAVEKVHLATSRTPFVILEHIPVIAAPAAIVHVVHDASTKAVYAAIRGTARGIGMLGEHLLACEHPNQDR